MMPVLSSKLAALLLAAVPSLAAPQEPPAIGEAPSLADPAVILLGLDASQRMTVDVSIAGTAATPFVVDTGSERTVVSRELAERLRLPAGPAVTVISMSGHDRVGTVHVPGLSMTGTRIGALVAPTLEGRHLGAPGIVGLDGLQDKRVLIDFEAATMTVEPAARREERWEPGTIVVRARSRFGHMILTEAEFGGERVQVILDTGAEVSIGNRALARRLARRGDGQPMALTSVTGGTVAAERRRVGSIRIADVEMRNLDMAFTDAPPFTRLGLDERPAILLGMDAMRLFRRVSIDFAQRRVRFLPVDAVVRQRVRTGSRLSGGTGQSGMSIGMGN